MVGQRFSRLTVVKFYEVDEKTRLLKWECICDCGNKTIVKGSLLKRGRTKSCGCLNREAISKAHKKHGMSNTKFYHVWNTMNMRCHNPNSTSYKDYGAKGIEVCDRWRIFSNFKDDMLPSYKEGLQIERIDNLKGYEPNNCRWATPVEQSNNTSRNKLLEYNGETLTMSEMARKYNVPVNTFKRRIYRGWSVERAIETK